MMGKVTGFLEIDRQDRKYAPASDRLRHYKEFVLPVSDATIKDQASRCMDCGIPFCHNGCPVNNQIPDWNDLVYNNDWQQALINLHSTNNFPEFTGRVCPAPCEASCTLNIEDTPVTIKSIECAIIDKGWEMGWVKPEIASRKTGRKVAVIGSGPAGMAAAQQLARAGHDVHLYEKHARAGGLLRYGIPDFKMEKTHVDRRVEQMEAEGVTFHYGAHIGVTHKMKDIVDSHDAVVMSGGAEKPRDLPIPGREFNGVHFAMDFLPQQNRRVSNEGVSSGDIFATGKHVVVIGGGDTGSDCIGTSNRQGAVSVTQLEIMPEPPTKENKSLTWPNWPLKLRTSSSHEEGADRKFAIATVRFEGDAKGNVTKLVCAESGPDFKPLPGTEFELKADLVLLAMGFTQPVHEGMVQELGVATDGRGNVKATDRDYKTSSEKVFVAGDMRRGQSLVVWAIREGRQAARAVDEFLMGETVLPR
jgi:glutamate synthase (NADPH) small chain